MNKELTRLSNRMDQLDDLLWAAERASNKPDQIKALRERSALWFRYAEIERTAGRDHVPATSAAQRDEVTADQLEGML